MLSHAVSDTVAQPIIANQRLLRLSATSIRLTPREPNCPREQYYTPRNGKREWATLRATLYVFRAGFLQRDPKVSEPIPVQETTSDLDLGFGTVVGGANEKRLLNRDGHSIRGAKGCHSSHRSTHTTSSFRYRGRSFSRRSSRATSPPTCCSRSHIWPADRPAIHAVRTRRQCGGRFGRAFFFSVETLGTIGYGNI